jgi:hypothetical protein
MISSCPDEFDKERFMASKYRVNFGMHLHQYEKSFRLDLYLQFCS